MKQYIFIICNLLCSIFAHTAETSNTLSLALDGTKNVVINAISQCRELAWMSNGIILVNGENSKGSSAIWSINTQKNNEIQHIASFADNECAQHNTITTDHRNTQAFISLKDSSIIWYTDKPCEHKKVRTIHRPVFQGNNLIMTHGDKCYSYDGKTETLLHHLNEAIKALSKNNMVNTFNNILAHYPGNENLYLANCQDMSCWNFNREKIEIIPLLDPTIDPLKMSINAYDLQFNCDGTLIAMVYNLSYSCFIYDFETKTIIPLQSEEKKQEVEKARQQYENNPTHKNGSLLLEAAFNSQYPTDARRFHPTIPYILATLLKTTGEIRYWNTKTFKVLVTQIINDQYKKQYSNTYAKISVLLPSTKYLRYMLNSNDVGIYYHNENGDGFHCQINNNRDSNTLDSDDTTDDSSFLTNPYQRSIDFSPDGKNLACALEEGVIIVPVPQEILALLNQ